MTGSLFGQEFFKFFIFELQPIIAPDVANDFLQLYFDLLNERLQFESRFRFLLEKEHSCKTRKVINNNKDVLATADAFDR